MEERVFLEQRLGGIFDSLGISLVRQSSSGTSLSPLGAYLTIIRLKDEATYWHCVRVALCGVKVAEALNLDFKPLFYAGLLHDIGKAAVDQDLLTKKHFTAADYEKMKPHVLHGYYLLRGVYNFSAEIILRHHRYYSDGYPKILPRSRVRYSKETKELIDHFAKVLAIIDFYDAATTRDNERSKEKEVKALLIQKFPNESEIINLCYEKGIFIEI
ncbi:MAG: HD domain-containing protein [bacterium]|nr:HD domain-containing protein [bacterium]